MDTVYVELTRTEILSLFYATDHYLRTRSEPPAADKPKCSKYKSCRPTVERLRDFFKLELANLDKLSADLKGEIEKNENK